MRWFGECWGPICTVTEQVPIPVGERCGYCEEEIGLQDSGVLMPHMDSKGWREMAEHRECFIQQIFGSLAHQFRACGCYGGSGTDPENLSRRESAKLAEKWLSHNLPNVVPQKGGTL